MHNVEMSYLDSREPLDGSLAAGLIAVRNWGETSEWRSTWYTSQNAACAALAVDLDDLFHDHFFSGVLEDNLRPH